MEERKMRLLHLSKCRGIGNQTVLKILNDDPNLNRIYEHNEDFWKEIIPNVERNLNAFLIDLQNSELRSENKGVSIISIFDDEYPGRLKHIHNAPHVLYCRGDIGLLHEVDSLAVIGTRSPSSYGVAATKEIIPGIAKENYCIVSGLAYGIDALAHSVALKHGGKCVAVIGGGLNNIYPKENKVLADRILSSGGLIISEHPPNTAPKPWHFTMRNRIISGLSKGIFVVEGKARSGTFITVQQGLEQGKDIFALPGSIFSENSIGTNFLIKEGAKLVINADSIIEEWS